MTRWLLFIMFCCAALMVGCTHSRKQGIIIDPLQREAIDYSQKLLRQAQDSYTPWEIIGPLREFMDATKLSPEDIGTTEEELKELGTYPQLKTEMVSTEWQSPALRWRLFFIYALP